MPRIPSRLIVATLLFSGLDAAPAMADPDLRAWDVREVRCTQSGRFKSAFLQRPNREWIERTAQHGDIVWREQNRDEWSVYLVHASGKRIQLDLHTKKVTVTLPGRPPAVLCEVSQARGVPSARPRPPQPLTPQPLTPQPPRPQPPTPRPVAPPSPDDDTPDVRLPGVSEAKTNAMVTWIVAEAGRLEQPACWKVSKPNTAGKVLSTCGPNEEKDGALCYPKCKSGYSGVGPVCWSGCPSDFTDTGAHCLKPKAYGRGAGYPWKFGDKAFSLDGARKRCKKAHGRCEKHGEIIYPKCRAGFSPAGCCICSPKCPSGMTDIGVSCEKKSYGRGAGRPMSCKSHEVQKGALCYPQCPSDYDHGGPVCWKRCGEGHETNCGAMCGKSPSVCALEVTNMVLASGELVANIAGAALTGGAANASMKAAKTAAKTGAKVAAKTALKSAIRSAGRSIRNKLQQRLGARVIAYATKKAGRNAGRKLAQDYAEMVLERAAKKIALAQASTDPDLREIVTMIDPTGVAEVINAFDKPLCEPKPLP